MVKSSRRGERTKWKRRKLGGRCIGIGGGSVVECEDVRGSWSGKAKMGEKGRKV